MRTECGRVASAAMFALVLGVVSTQVEASELSAGVSLGSIQAGTAPRFAVGPHAGISWHLKKNLLLKVHDLCSVVPPIQIGGPGVYNHTSVALGYSWRDGDIGVGPSVALYFMPACGSTLCGQVAGMAVGGHAQANAYIAGPLGISASANLDWIDGRSLVLPGYASIVVVAGPVMRWSSR
jgi:hypothetical protein